MADESTPPGGEPPEDDLPPTGAHDIVPGDDDDDLLGERIPSFEEYRRAREESQRGGSESGRGEEPESSREWFGGGEEGPDDEDTLRADAGDEEEALDRATRDEPGDDEDAEYAGSRGGSDEDDDDDAEYAGSRRKQGEQEDADYASLRGEDEDADYARLRDEAGEHEDGEDGGDTLDGGEPLEGVELADDDEQWSGELGEGETPGEGAGFEGELARHAADLFPTSAEHTAEEIHQRRLAAHRRHRRNGRIRLLLLVGVVALVVAFVLSQSGGKKTPPASKPPAAASTPTSRGTGKSYLALGSPSALPGNLLIADDGARKLLVVSPKGQVVWTYRPSAFLSEVFNPDYAFFTPSGSEITVTEEPHSLIESVDVGSKGVIYTYGRYDVQGSAANRLRDPSAALRENGGDIIAADIGNCRVIVLTEPKHHVVRQLGKTGTCTHAPPTTFSSPDSAFPLSDGGVVVTESDGYADLLSASGKLTQALRIPGFKLASDTNEVGPGVFISVDHTHPGAVEIFNTKGKVQWSYRVKSGAGELFLPSFAEVLPKSGDVLVGDDYNDRVIVIDRRTNKIVWQYGRTGVASGRKGYLDLPVGLDLVHPDSLLDRYLTVAPPS